YVGDPRMVEHFAPEMSGVVDDFFRGFRDAGFRVGLTVRPQKLVSLNSEAARQKNVWDYVSLLSSKMDYARRRWGATLFYIDSNGGPLWPAEAFQFYRLSKLQPGTLIIPEHQQPLYFGFSAPYDEIRQGDTRTAAAIRALFPRCFKVLNIADATARY